MKKLLLCLLILVLTLGTVVACVSEDEENPTPDTGYEAPDYGRATVYAPGDSVLLITSQMDDSVAKMRDAIDSITSWKGHGGVTTGTIYNQNQKLEIVFQIKQEDESRPIIKTAEKYLDRVEKDSYFEARYVIYADSGQLAVVFDENEYTNLQAVEYVVDLFLEKHVNGRQYVALPAGVIESGVIDLKYLQEEIDIEYTANQWAQFEKAAKDKYGDYDGARIVDAFRTYYSMIDDRVVGWWANMYDPGIGGFYGTSSGRDHLGYLPNIEGTDQILGHLSSSGMLDTLGGNVTNNLPSLMVHQLVYYFKSLQNPTNRYFYNPQLGISGTSTYRLGRDQGRCTSRLIALGSRPTYNHPNGTAGDGITADQYWDMMVEAGEISPDQPRPYVPTSLQDYEDHLNNKNVTGSLGESKDVAVSKIVLAASEDASEFVSSFEKFDEWLKKYGDSIDKNPYSGVSNINATYTTIAAAANKIGKSDDSTKWYYGMDYKEMVIKVLNDHMNDKGLFGTYDKNSTDPSAGCKYANTNGLMKAIPIYTAWEIAYPMPLEAVQGCLLGIMSDEKSTGNICETYNIWEALSGVLSNVSKFGTEEQKRELLGYTDSTGVYHQGTVEKALGEYGPDAVINTYNKQKNYQTSEGGFSHNVSKGGTENGGLPIGLGLKENNVDANGFGMQSVINAMANCFGLRSYRPALFTESDWMEFIDIVLELQPVIKYSYDEMNGTSAIDKVFTFEDGLPAQGLSVTKTSSFPNNTHQWSENIGKDGEKGVLRIDKASDGSGSSMNLIANANVKASGATLTTFEVDIKYTSITAKSESQIQLGTLSKTSMREMPVFILLTFDGTAAGSKIRYSDYSNGSSNQQNIDTGAVVGEWFTLKVEYYSGDMNTFRFRTYINDKLIYTSNAIYSQKIVAGADTLPGAGDIQRATWSFNEKFKGTFEFDNVSLIQSRATLEGDVGVGEPGKEEMPDVVPEGPPESIPDVIPEGITTPAADDAIKFDTIPDSAVTGISSADFLNVYYTTNTVTGDSVLYIDKRSHLDSNSGVIFRQSPTKVEENATIAIFEADLYISAYEQVEVIQFTAGTSNATSPYMMVLKAVSKEKGSVIRFNNYHWDAANSKSVGQNWIDTTAKVGEWFRVRIEYEVTSVAPNGAVDGIRYRMFVNNILIKEDTAIYGSALSPNGGTNGVPSVETLNRFTFSFNASTKGRMAVDNFSFRKLVKNDYVPGDLVIPEPIIGSGFTEPEGAVTFKESFEDIVAAGTVKVDTKEASGNTYSVVTERGDKMLSMVKTDGAAQEIFYHYAKSEAGSYDFVTYEAVLKYAPAEGSTNGDMEIAFLDGSGEKVLYTYINYKGADGALQIKAYKRTSEGTVDSDYVTTEKPIKAGEFFKIRIEYVLGSTEDCTKIYINDECLIKGAYYSGTKGEGDSYTDTPYTAINSAVILNYTKFVGTTFIDYSFLETKQTPESTISFDKDWMDKITPITNSAFAGDNTWKVETVEGNNVLTVSKLGVDTSGTSWNGGLSFVVKPTEVEKNPTIAVFEFDMYFPSMTNASNQITMGHQGLRSNSTSPMLYSIDIKGGVLQHVVFFYEVLEVNSSNIPTKIRYGYSINGSAPVIYDTPYEKATSLAVNGGSYQLPRVDQVESFTFALNNSFKGEGWFDNFRLALLTSYELPNAPVDPPHEHKFVNGKCECGETDPNYKPDTPVEPETSGTIDFENGIIPEKLVIATNKDFTELNTWSVVDAYGSKVLFVNKAGKDTSGTSWNGGVTFKYAPTKIESDAEVAVISFNVRFEKVTGFDTQITLQHQGKTGKGVTPFLLQIPSGNYGKDLAITIVYQPTAFGSDGTPTAMKYWMTVNGDIVAESEEPYEKATDIINGNVKLPRVEQIDTITIALNNSFLGEAYFDNFKLELLKEVPHEHKFIDGKCECGETDPGYVAPNYNQTQSFDEMPAGIVYTAIYVNPLIVADPKNGDNKVLEIDPAFSAVTKSFDYSVTDIKADASVVAFETDVFISDDSAITFEIFLLTRASHNERTKYAAFAYFAGLNTNIFVNGTGTGSHAVNFTMDTWHKIRVEYKVVGEGDSKTPDVSVYFDGDLVATSNGLYGTGYYTEGVLNNSAVPAVTDINGVKINVSSSITTGKYYFDNMLLHHLNDDDVVDPPHEHEFVNGKCECGETDPNWKDTSVLTFDEMPETSLLVVSSGNAQEAPYIQGANTWEIVTVENGDNKVLHISKGANGQLVGVPNDNGTPDDPSDDYTEDKSSTNWGVSVKSFVTYAEENANVAVFEAKYLFKNLSGNSGMQFRLYGASQTAANAPFMLYFATGGNPSDGDEFTYADYYNGNGNKDSEYYGKHIGAVVGTWFTLRIEYRITETAADGTPTAIEYSTYVNGDLFTRSSSIYGKNIISGSSSIPKISDITMMNFAFNNAYLGDFYVDDISLKLIHEEPHEHEFVDGKCECGETDPNYAPHEHEFVNGKCECGETDPNYVVPFNGVVDFSADYSAYLSFSVNKDFDAASPRSIVEVDGNKMLFIDKNGRDTTNSLGGISLVVTPTLVEEGATVAVFEMDYKLENMERFANQITVNHKNGSGAKNSPFLMTIPRTYNAWVHITITYKVIATDEEGKPTAIQYSVQYGDEEATISTDIYGANIKSGSTAIPAASELTQIVFGLNNDFLGDAYFDNISFKLLKDYKTPHIHEYADGKCKECGKADPSYVTFDEMPASNVTKISSSGITAAGIIGTNTWEIVTVEEGNKALYINKGANGQGYYTDDNGTPDDTSDDVQKQKELNTNCGVSIAQFVTQKDENANVMIFDIDVMYKTITNNDVIQINVGTAANSPLLGVFRPSGNAEGSAILNNSENIERGETTAKVGEWFHIRIEYRVTETEEDGTPKAIEVKYIVNDGEPYVSTTVYKKMVKISDISVIYFAFNNRNLGEYYVDNISLRLVHE